MGLTGAHLLVLVVPVVVLAAIAAGLYFVIRKAVAAGVREGQRRTPVSKEQDPER